VRQPKGWEKTVISVYCIFASLFHLYTAATGVLPSRYQRGFHLLFFLPLAFLLFPATRKSPQDRVSVPDWILAILAAAPSLFVILEAERLESRWEFVTPVFTSELLIGILLIVILLESVRRAVAPAMAWLALLAILYLFFGHHLPGMLYHSPYALSQAVEICYLVVDDGIYGSITGISAVFVVIFVIFGAFIYGMGLGQYFMDVAVRLAGKSVGGPAKIAVVSSACFGTISGSAAANVFATGTFTIPMMKKVGYRPQFAGSVEAAASTGGQLMPPVMGAAAFLMAEITHISYLSICIAAAIPAVLYFFSVGSMVHIEALKHRLTGLSEVNAPSLSSLLKGSYLMLPVVALLAYLIIGYSPFKAAFVSILTALAISFVNRKNWMTPRRILDALEQGGKDMIMIAGACACAGLIISIVVNTGLALKFSSLVISFSKGNFILALLLIMVSAVILGMGLPTTAAYVLAVSVGGPALVKMGGELLSVHLFVFYFAILACVTPPVALAAYAGASIAKTDPLKTGFEASKLVFAGYIIPYMVIYNPALMFRGTVTEIFMSSAVALLSIFLLAMAIEGYGIGGPLIFLERLLGFAGAILLPFPLIFNRVTSFWVALGLLISIIAQQRLRKRKAILARAAAPTE
jgi:TRAP transporter 4TM/12TM fusion protein